MSKTPIRKWKTVETVESNDFKIFAVNTVRRVSPRTNKAHDFYHIQTADWLNVIALTPDGSVVFIEQYRHGSDTVQLEIPGGIVDSGETHVQAALRELAEETGYIGKSAVEIGRVNPNPALFGNACRTFLVQDAVAGPQNLEETEDIAIRLVPLSEIPQLIGSGQVEHGLVVSAFYFYEHYSQH